MTAFGLTPRLALDFTTATLSPIVTFSRSGNTATRVNSLGYIESINADLPRFDYNPFTLACRGLLVEGTQSNLQINSNLFNAWAKSNVTVVLDGTEVSPDGTNSANKITLTSTTGNVTTNPSVALSAGAHTSSVYAKKGNTDFIVVRLRQTGVTDIALVRFNLATGTVASTTAGSGRITAVGNGWYRCEVSGTAAAANHTTIIYPNNTSGQASGEYVFCYGAQLEAGAFATSYIPTEATALTRNADVATITGTNFSSFWQASKGGVLVRARPGTVSGTRPWVQFDDNTADNIIALRGVNADPQLYIKATTDQATIDAGTIAANTDYALTGWWQTDNCKARLNKGAVVTDTSATIPTVTQARLGSDGTEYLNGHLASISYYDTFSGQIYTQRKNKAVFSLL